MAQINLWPPRGYLFDPFEPAKTRLRAHTSAQAGVPPLPFFVAYTLLILFLVVQMDQIHKNSNAKCLFEPVPLAHAGSNSSFCRKFFLVNMLFEPKHPMKP